jgi:hypothetical protein
VNKESYAQLKFVPSHIMPTGLPVLLLMLLEGNDCFNFLAVGKSVSSVSSCLRLLIAGTKFDRFMAFDLLDIQPISSEIRNLIP